MGAVEFELNGLLRCHGEVISVLELLIEDHDVSGRASGYGLRLSRLLVDVLNIPFQAVHSLRRAGIQVGHSTVHASNSTVHACNSLVNAVDTVARFFDLTVGRIDAGIQLVRGCLHFTTRELPRRHATERNTGGRRHQQKN